MNFEEVLSCNSSRALIDMVVETVGNDPDKFNDLLNLAVNKSYPLSFRASWAISHCTSKHPELLLPQNYHSILEIIFTCQEIGVRRCLLRSIIYHPFPEDEALFGQLIDKCFQWIHDPKSPVSLKYYCLEILYRACKLLPDLKGEFIAILIQLLPLESKGFKNRAKKILSEFSD